MTSNSSPCLYVYCPYGLVTGGSDALHQLVYYVNRIKPVAHLVYCDITQKDKPIPKAYQGYIDDYLLTQDVEDNEENAILLPETLSFYLRGFTKLHKYLWWLSVDNNVQAKQSNKCVKILKKFFSMKTWKRIFSGYYSPKKIHDYQSNKPYDFAQEDPSVIHLYASYYAGDYLQKHSRNPQAALIEPISKFYLDAGPYQKDEGRKKVILYNPAKNAAFSKRIIRCSQGLTFLPLSGYTQEELLSLYRQNRVYMDFGPFPGAERIPKEAVYNGCLILTGKNGASAFDNDVPLPPEDKIDATTDNIGRIEERLHYLVDHYTEEYPREETYRKTVGNLEKNFNNSLQDIFARWLH
jgi:hypothetical protein